MVAIGPMCMWLIGLSLCGSDRPYVYVCIGVELMW